MKTVDLFQVNDLYEAKNLYIVVDNLFALGGMVSFKKRAELAIIKLHKKYEATFFKHSSMNGRLQWASSIMFYMPEGCWSKPHRELREVARHQTSPKFPIRY